MVQHCGSYKNINILDSNAAFALPSDDNTAGEDDVTKIKAYNRPKNKEKDTSFILHRIVAGLPVLVTTY